MLLPRCRAPHREGSDSQPGVHCDIRSAREVREKIRLLDRGELLASTIKTHQVDLHSILHTWLASKVSIALSSSRGRPYAKLAGYAQQLRLIRSCHACKPHARQDDGRTAS
jgi:hypothetical protein